jgi:hypothetical protein
LRKADNTFLFASLVNQVGAKVKAWLHQTQRIRFLKLNTHKKSNQKLALGDGIKGGDELVYTVDQLTHLLIE